MIRIINNIVAWPEVTRSAVFTVVKAALSAGWEVSSWQSGNPFTRCRADFEFTPTMRATSGQNSKLSCSNLCHALNLSVIKAEINTKTERISRMVNEVAEINTHAVDKVPGAELFIGIHRRVDKLHRAQVYNYRLHLLPKLLLREPASAPFLSSRTGPRSASQKLICGSLLCGFIDVARRHANTGR
jgi:hypothetical protein